MQGKELAQGFYVEEDCQNGLSIAADSRRWGDVYQKQGTVPDGCSDRLQLKHF